MTLAVICIAALGLVIALWLKRTRSQKELERHSVTSEALHALLSSNKRVLLFDVRLPLDLLSDSEMIPGATRIPPSDLLKNPSLIPKNEDSVVYCTCPGDKTSRGVLQRAKAMGFMRVRFLRDGLAGWKARGYPVERYKESFHLDTKA